MNRSKLWFEAWGEESAQNSLLKALLIGAFVLITVESIGLVTISLREPTIIAVGVDRTSMVKNEKIDNATSTAEIRRVMEKYVDGRYSWSFNDVSDSLKSVEPYLLEEQKTAFRAKTADSVKVAAEKMASQRIHVAEVQIDEEKGAAYLTGDKILDVDGLLAANEIVLTIEFERGSRTPQNPEGVYIKGDRLELKERS